MTSLNKKPAKILGILTIIFTFLALSLAATVESAQTKTTAKPTSSPTKKKTTSTPPKTAKTTSTPKTTPAKPATPVAFSQVIATAAGARVRAKDSTSSAELRRVKLGTVIKVISKSDNDWYQIEIPAKPKNVVGWMSGQVADDWDATKREEIYRRIIDKNYTEEESSFLDASELYDFLTKAQTELKGSKSLPEYNFKRLVVLSQALKAVPFDKEKENPYKTFLKANEKSVVYSEPAGAWYVRSESFWNLRKQYSTLPLAEDIAWAAAGNPLPGECEGYVNCYLFILRETDAEYLNLYPNGKYAAESLKNIQNQLEPIVSDLTENNKSYSGPTDVSDRAEFNRLIAEIRTIVSKLPIAEPEKQKTIQQLIRIAEGFR